MPDRTIPLGESQPTATTERVVAKFHTHARRLTFSALVLIAVPGVVAYFYGSLPEAWENNALLIAGIISLLLFCLIPFLLWASHSYILTTRRVVIRKGLLTQVRQELLHSRSYDLVVKRSPLQRLFGSGDILINTGLDRPIVMRDIPQVLLVQRSLQELMERSANSVATRRQMNQAGRIPQN